MRRKYLGGDVTYNFELTALRSTSIQSNFKDSTTEFHLQYTSAQKNIDRLKEPVEESIKQRNLYYGHSQTYIDVTTMLLHF